jgi:hypothetical protein
MALMTLLLGLLVGSGCEAGQDPPSGSSAGAGAECLTGIRETKDSAPLPRFAASGSRSRLSSIGVPCTEAVY